MVTVLSAADAAQASRVEGLAAGFRLQRWHEVGCQMPEDHPQSARA
jgi:hypothetical protein